MNEYIELINKLREEAEWEEYLMPHSQYETPKLLSEAADVIEELTAYALQIEELRKNGYYLQKTKMMTYGQATMTMPLPEPPKEET